jgi:hypothetical protein
MDGTSLHVYLCEFYICWEVKLDLWFRDSFCIINFMVHCNWMNYIKACPALRRKLQNTNLIKINLGLLIWRHVFLQNIAGNSSLAMRLPQGIQFITEMTPKIAGRQCSQIKYSLLVFLIYTFNIRINFTAWSGERQFWIWMVYIVRCTDITFSLPYSEKVEVGL